MLSGNCPQDHLHVLAKAHVQHLVRLIQHHHTYLLQLDRMAVHMIHHSAGGTHNDLDTGQSPDLSGDILSAIHREDPEPFNIFCDFPQLLRRLDRQLPGGTEHNSLKLLQAGIHPCDQRDAKGSCLSRSCLSLTDDILPLQKRRDCLLLNGSQRLKAHIGQCPADSGIQLLPNTSQLFVLYLLICCGSCILCVILQGSALIKPLLQAGSLRPFLRLTDSRLLQQLI